MDVGAEIVMGLVGRYDGPPWPHPHCLSRMATLDAGYCLDAPALFPAGAMQSWEIEGESIPLQLWVERELHEEGR